MSLPSAHADEIANFDLPAQPLIESLRALARQTNLNVFFEPKLVAGREAPAVKGKVSIEEALKNLLKDSGLTFRHVDDKTFTIVVAGADDEASLKGNEVVVTGSRIHGANPTSPVRVLGRVDIDRTGYSQLGDVIRSLPENFSGGQNPGCDRRGHGQHFQPERLECVDGQSARAR
ncbi:MAG: STN domain-containing protein [Gammaproteobacteria bacterium]